MREEQKEEEILPGEMEMVVLHRRYSSAFCKTLLYRSGLILNPYSITLSRYGLISGIMSLSLSSNKTPIVPIGLRFMDCATILALLSSSKMASADISDARIIASASPSPKIQKGQTLQGYC